RFFGLLPLLHDFQPIIFYCDDLCIALELMDIVNNLIRGSNILDHILVSRGLVEVYKKENVIYNAPIGNSDHLTLYAVPEVIIRPRAAKFRIVEVYDLRKSNLVSLHNSLSKANLEALLCSSNDANEQCAIFSDILNTCIQSSIPMRHVIMTQRDKEWLTPMTKSLIDERWEAYRKRDWRNYKRLKEKVRNEIKRSKRLFCEKMKQTTRGLWKIVKSISGRSNVGSWDPLISDNSPEMLANTIVDFLNKKYTARSDDILIDELSINDDNWTINIEERLVYEHLKKLNRRKAVGVDNVPTRVYSEMADCLAKPLKLIFDTSIKQRVFPSLWKTAIISPIPKTNPPDPGKLRPISLLPVISKLFEKIVLEKNWFKFETHYGNSQHGFRPAHSTTTAVINLLESALFQYDDISKDGVAIVSFDMSSAFDCIDHVAVVKKFCEFQFPNGFSKWLRSYLTERRFMVKIDGTFSRPGSISRGVPQGSVLGPSIFSVFTSDLVTVNSSAKMVKYADDISIVIPLRMADAENKILAEIHNVEAWCAANKLTLNKDKSHILRCVRNQDLMNLELPVPSSSVITVLGVIINEKFTWNDHIKKIVKKCNQRFFILRKLKQFVDPEELRNIYTALIRSLLEYASPSFVCLPKGLERQLQKIERRAFKLIYSDSPKQNDFSSELKTRREAASKKLFLKIAKDKRHILHDEIPKRLRFSGHFNIKQTRTKKYQQSFFPYVSLLLNGYHLL
ncbi:MAG: reverse transcriptase family protein, partial [Pseudomonadota bacterium]